MKPLSISLLSGLLAALAAMSAHSDDTEVFLSQFGAGGGSAGHPKVLVVLDNSGSMRTIAEQGSKPEFDPSHDWLAEAGAPGQLRSDRIYWSTSGAPPSAGTSQYIQASANRCNTAANTLGTTGTYSDFTQVYYGKWKRKDGRWRWVEAWNKVGNNSATRGSDYLDCKADVDGGDAANPGSPAQSDGFPCKGGDDPYCASANVNWDTRGSTNDWRNLFSANYMAWYHNDSLVSPDRSRLDIAKEVVSSLVESNPQVDFGLMVFNYNNGNNSGSKNGGRVVKRVDAMDDAARADYIDIVNSLGPDNWTPLCETFYEAYRYIAMPNGSALGVYYGNDDPDASPSRDPCAENGAGGCSHDGTYDSPLGACEQMYVILMTDGRPTYDLHANAAIKALPGIDSCGTYRTDHGGSSAWQENCMPQMAKHLFESDLDDDESNGNQRVITYTIGFHTDQDLLRDTAENGGGTYFTTDTAQGLATAFQATINEIMSTNTTFAAPGVAVDTFNRTRSLDDIFTAMFRPQDRPRWPGNLKKLIIDGTGTVRDKNGVAAIDATTGFIKDAATTFWSPVADGPEVERGGAGGLLATNGPGARTIKTNTGTDEALEDFAVSNDALTADMLGADDALQRLALISWAKGVDVLDEDEDDSITDSRPWIMGDVIHSRPLAINYGGSTDSPDLRVVFGTNAGFMHMIGASDGGEDWAFFPKELAEINRVLYDNDMASAHPYGVDGSPVAYIRDTDGDGTIETNDGDKVHLYFGLRRGGDDYYALDISTPDNPSFMWRVDSSILDELGQSWSAPVVTEIPGHDKPVAIVGAGYDTNKDALAVGSPDSSGRGIYILDAIDGSVVWSLTPAAGSATNLQETALDDSVPGSVAAVDSDGDHLTDRIYFADTGGSIWRVDLVGAKADWTAFRLASLGGDTATTDRRFFNQIDVARTRYKDLSYDAVLIGSGNRAHPLEETVVNRFYMIRDFQVLPARHLPDDGDQDTDPCSSDTSGFRCAEAPPAITEDLLYDATANLVQDGSQAQQTAALGTLGSASTKGWYITLETTGEKTLSRSVTIGGTVFFTTYAPPDSQTAQNICKPQAGSGSLYGVDLNDARAVYDWSTLNGTTLAKQDRKKHIGYSLPDHPVAHFGASEIRLVGVGAGTDGKGSEDTGVELRTGGLYWFQDGY